MNTNLLYVYVYRSGSYPGQWIPRLVQSTTMLSAPTTTICIPPTSTYGDILSCPFIAVNGNGASLDLDVFSRPNLGLSLAIPTNAVHHCIQPLPDISSISPSPLCRQFSCPPSLPIVKQHFNVDIWYPKPCRARRYHTHCGRESDQ